MKQHLQIYLPDIATYEIEDLGFSVAQNEQLSAVALSVDWQTQLCRSLGLAANDLPWTQLRLSQFEMDNQLKIACCCDPVLMQLTHRGAYMLGQAPLSLSHNDAIRVVAQINERLMRPGEKLFLLNKNAWLLTSEQSKELTMPAIKELVGKDMFNYPYQGVDAEYWQKLTTEIQMLIKQMIDYQGLPATQPETIMNVHCYDLINLEKQVEMPFVKNESLVVFSNNELIETFCLNSFLASQPIENLESVQAAKKLVVAFDGERDVYSTILDFWQESVGSRQYASVQLVCQDSVISRAARWSWLKNYFNFKI